MLKAPYPWFGGKRRVAADVWARFGDVKNFVDPFFGSNAVLLNRPPFEGNRIETINDIDGHVANFWRALRAAPDEVARYADWPVNELDLHARGDWLYYRPDAREWVERLRGDPDYYDAKSAGWWVWFVSCWIGNLPSIPEAAGDGPNGVARKRPHLSNAGMGVKRQIPATNLGGVAAYGDGGAQRAWLTDYFAQLATRMEGVRVCCGDWRRVLGPSVTVRHGLTAVFLDPPYSHAERDKQLYSHDNDIASDVRQWAIENGDNPQMRIALCGYDTEHGDAMPDGWYAHSWKAHGGYGRQSNGRGRANSSREVVWFSPHCLRPERENGGATLFALAAD